MTAATSCPGPHARYGLCYHQPPHTDLDRMLAALAEAERQERVTIHGDEADRLRLAEHLLVGVGLNDE